MWEYRHTDELYHFGRKGMKWGQHIFGKVKAAIRNRKRERDAIRKERAQAAEESRKRARELARPVSELSDAELKARINRLRSEKDYLDLQKQISSFTPQKVNKGKEFLKKFMNEAVTPKLTEAGKKLIQNVLDKQIEKLTGAKDVTKTVDAELERLKEEKKRIDRDKEKASLRDYISRGGEESVSAYEQARRIAESEKDSRFRGYVDRGGMTDEEYADELEYRKRYNALYGGSKK